MTGAPGNPSKALAFRPVQPNNILAKLFSVTITHNYYTLNDALCPDFAIEPTPSSARLMASLGLAFRPERNGFTVFIEKGKRAELIAYLAKSAENAGAAGCWERLTFSMRLTNPLFVSITELPVATKTTQNNLYGCNGQSHREDQTVLLNAGRFMGADALYPVVGDELTLDLPATARRVLVKDIAGAIVVPAPGGDDIVIYAPATQSAGRSHATVDFSALPYDLYKICVIDDQDQPVGGGKYPWSVLHIAQQPDSMVLLDMLFVRPTPASAGVYPISLPFERTLERLFEYLPYRLAFDARSTCWQYFVVSRDPAGVLSQLQIKGADAVFTEAATRTVLPDGTTAIVFQSQSPLPLRQKSALHFQLTGRRRDANGHDNPIKISRLPVAASTPVWPGHDQQSSAGISEIFVYV